MSLPLSPSGQRVVSLRFHILGAACFGLMALSCFAAKREKTEGPPPTVRIATEPLDYHPLSSFYLMSRSSSSSLDFIDKDHLLFTFRVTGLLTRLPECRPDDEDQLIRALVVHLPDGKVEKSADWRMHDRGRYLWSLGGGKFMVRSQNSLSTTDSSLELQAFLKATSPIRLVKLSPDARLLLVENDFEKHTAEQHEKLVETAEAEGLTPPKEDVQATIFRLADGTVMLRTRLLNPVDVPLISEGYIEILSGRGDHWMLRYQPFQGEASVIGDITSSCHPSEIPLNSQTAFVSVCPSKGDDHFLQAISLTGKTLWSYRWDGHYIWPTTSVSEGGQRIAFSTLRVARPVSTYDPIDETELQAQRVDVLDTTTGRVELTQFATPVLSAGQNYALSPNGDRFAVLRENAIEIYDLPPPAAAATGASQPEGIHRPDFGGAD